MMFFSSLHKRCGLLFLSALICIAGTAAPKLIVSPQSSTVLAGESTTLKIGVTTDKPIDFRSFQADVTIPDGFRLMKIEAPDSYNQFQMLPSLPSEGRTGKVTVGMLDLTSLNGSSLSSQDYLLTIEIKADENANPTTDNITVSNASFGTSSGEDVLVEGEEEISVTINVPLKSITIDPAQQSVLIGSSVTFTANLNPLNTSSTEVKWSLPENSCAVIEKEEGLSVTIKGISVGETEVTVTSVGNESVSATANLTVNPIEATSVSLNKTSVTLGIGQEETLIATVSPDNVTDQSVTWTSTQSRIVSVEGGKIKALDSGTASIKATCGNVSTECEVKVISSGDVKIEPGKGTGNGSGDGELTDDPVKDTESGAVVSGNDILMRVGQTAGLKLTAEGVDALPDFEWSVAESAIASVSPGTPTIEATFTGVAVGETTWSVKAKGSEITLAEGKITVIAEKPISSIRLDVEDITMALNAQPQTVTAIITPADASLKQLKWEVTEGSDNIKVAVDGSNTLSVTITPQKAGVAKVKVSAEDGSKTSTTFTVTVKNVTDEHVTVKPGEGTTENGDDENPGENTKNGGSLNGNDITLRVNQEAGLKLEIVEEFDVAPEVEWNIENTGIASVTTKADDSLEATFKGISVGETIYTVKLKDKGTILLTGSVTVIAEKPISEIRLDIEDITMTVNARPQTVKATVTPANASLQQLKWEVTEGSENITLTVDASNSLSATITPQKAGVAQVKVSAEDGSKTSVTFLVTVKEISSGDVKIEPGDGSGEGEFTDDPVKDTENGAVINGNDILMRVGQTATLKLTAEGVDALPDLEWNVTESDIASVSPDASTLEATFTGIAVGETTWTVKAKGSENVLADGKITVIAEISTDFDFDFSNSEEDDDLTGVEITSEGITIEVGYSYRLTPKANDGNVLPVLEWSSENPEIATVDSDGLLTSKSVGTTIVKAGATVKGEEVEASVKVTVIPASVRIMTLSTNTLTLNEGDAAVVIYATHAPVQADEPAVIWSSDNESVVKVEHDGTLQATLHAVAAGSAKVKVEHADNPEISDICVINVVQSAGLADVLTKGNYYGWAVYDVAGRYIMTVSDEDGIDSLRPGIYILRSGKESAKILVK